MAIALIVIGLTLLVAAANLNVAYLYAIVGNEFKGSNNFFYWILAFLMIGAIGYVPQLRKFSYALLALVIVAIALNKGQGFFAQLQKAVTQTAVTTNQTQGTQGTSTNG